MPPEPTLAAVSTWMLLERALFLIPLVSMTAFFAGTETALLSLSMPQRESLAQQAVAGSSAAARILWLLSNPRRLITTLILGNEVINISISAVVTGLVTRLVKLVPERVSAALSRGDDVAVTLLATLIALPLIILFGELIPKTIGIKLAARWATVASSPMVLITWVLWIPRFVVSAIAGAVAFPFMGKGARQGEGAPVLREQEFRTLVDMGNAEGEIAGTERRLIHNVLDFGDLTVGKVKTRAEQVFALSAELPLGRLVEAVSRQRYSRVPIYRGRRDNVIGILFAKDLVGYAQGDLEGRPLSDLLHPPLFVPRRAKCDRLFREFQRRKTHMALVVDEYGKLAGLVTMEDLLHALFGNIADGMTPTSPPTPDPDQA